MKPNTEKAKILRKNLTSQEQKIWNFLRTRTFYGLQFRRQYPIGNYIVDFICREKKLIIEIDGGQHNETKNCTYDNLRTKFLESLGFRVIRYWNSDIDNNIEGIFQDLKNQCNIN